MYKKIGNYLNIRHKFNRFDKKEILKIDQSKASILRLVLDDPHNKNALSEDMMKQLKKHLIKASSDDSVK